MVAIGKSEERKAFERFATDGGKNEISDEELDRRWAEQQAFYNIWQPFADEFDRARIEGVPSLRSERETQEWLDSMFIDEYGEIYDSEWELERAREKRRNENMALDMLGIVFKWLLIGGAVYVAILVLIAIFAGTAGF